MRALRALLLDGCYCIGHGSAPWLPSSSAHCIEFLLAIESKVEDLHTDMPALQVLAMPGSVVRHDWHLSAATPASVQCLWLCATSVGRVPEGMAALRHVDVSYCRQLDPDWLPDSSKACVSMLDAFAARDFRLPARLQLLESLDMLRQNPPQLHQAGVSPDWRFSSDEEDEEPLQVLPLTSLQSLRLARLDSRFSYDPALQLPVLVAALAAAAAQHWNLNPRAADIPDCRHNVRDFRCARPSAVFFNNACIYLGTMVRLVHGRPSQN